MRVLRGDPTRLFMKPEIPVLFFLHLALPVLIDDPDSSESLLNGVEPLSELVGVNVSRDLSPAEKLADCLRDGVNIRASGEV